MRAESLQRSYDLLIAGRENPISFTEGLKEYLKLVLVVPILNKFFEENSSRDPFKLLQEFSKADSLFKVDYLPEIVRKSKKDNLRSGNVLRMHSGLIGLAKPKGSTEYEGAVVDLKIENLVDAVKAIHAHFLRILDSDSVEPNFWITQKNEEYYFKDKKVYIESRGAKYVKIFNIVFMLMPRGGDMPYPEIIKACGMAGIKTDQRKIQRALTSNDANFFRYVKDITRVPAGKPLFVAGRNGERLIFNNTR